jgi:DNA polymerase-1
LQLIIDIEADKLENPTKIWCVCLKDIATGEYYVFRNLHEDQTEVEKFKALVKRCKRLVGHNILGYDYPVLCNLIHFHDCISLTNIIDTLIISKLFDYSRQGHSIEDYGIEFNLPKGEFNDWSRLTKEMVTYCIRDVDICQRIYLNYLNDINNPKYRNAITCEHKFQIIVNSLHDNGFYFDTTKCNKLLEKVTTELKNLDEEILKSFPPKLTLIREIHPERTKHGTLHRKDFRWVQDGDLTEFNGFPFCRCEYRSFNPSSHKQIVDVLTRANWKPTDRTKTHIEAIRQGIVREDLNKYGWKINETNISTLPHTAPTSARTLAKRILYEARRRTLTEWINLYNPDTHRIHGKFVAIGAWTHRMAHQKPNMANIPNELDTQGKVKLLGGEMRSCFSCPKNKLLVGVDAEGIQLRIFAHYIDDQEFTDAIVKGSKSEQSDPHSLNQRILGSVCKSRAAAKRFIYALLLGAGIRKLSEVLDTGEDETKKALDRLLGRYEGFSRLKKTIIPKDAKRGYFFGLDGRKVKILGETEGERRHLTMSGYLQNGEAVVMKHATILWLEKVKEHEQRLRDASGMVGSYPILEDSSISRLRILNPPVDKRIQLVNLVHDEWQTEMPSNDLEEARWMAETQCNALREVGEMFGLKCPLAGSYMNDGKETIGTNWKVTH